MSARPDGWQLDAGHRLRKHLMHAVTLGKNFAPDQTYELSKAGKVGPLSAQIAEIFQRHADLWAEEARLAKCCGADVDGDTSWVEQMLAAEVEVGRFIAGHTLRGAA